MFLDRIGVRALALALSAPLSASTYIVDDNAGPGVDFTDIPPAIAFAQAGDVLLVAPGTYSGFVLDKGLVIVGRADAVVSGWIEVRNVPPGLRAAVVDFQTTRFVVDNCAAAVVLQELRMVTTGSVTGSPDVRIARTRFQQSVPPDGQPGVVLTNARLEFVDGWIFGHRGVTSGVPAVPGGNGGAAVLQQNARLVISKASAVWGGSGSSESVANVEAGWGGPGLEMSGGSTAVLLGLDSNVAGGPGGLNFFYNDCYYDGCGAFAVNGDGTAAVTSSGTTLEPFECYEALHCIHTTGPAVYGATLIEPTPAQPSLEVSSPPLAGATLTFTLRGEPGATAALTIGRGFVVTPTPGVTMENLLPGGRVFQLGPIPANGVREFSIVVPANVPSGYVFVAQAQVIGTNGLARTNSTPIVVR